MENSKDIKNEQNSQTTPAAFRFEELELSIPAMLKNGVHFGHKKSRWNPKMKPYIFAERGSISIINLEKTVPCFEKAIEFTKTLVINGGKVLFVGTKPQVREILKNLAEAVEMPYVTNRWLGGTLTNFPEIKKRIKYLNEQESKLEKGELKKYTKYEQMRFKKEIERMNEKMGGIKKMEGLPQAIFVSDMKENDLAIREAKEMKIPVVAIADTNTNPDSVEYSIPGNDDALSSLRYVIGMIAKSIKEAKAEKMSAAKDSGKEDNKNIEIKEKK